ncbi:S1 family peptidase [Streptomyces stelliscabiei]|uniref:Streptogrisin D n=1 Tax=Streptomyces stelliscabiei TaxID=146820 RepID=A0A8I0P923_9ACTN|nr:S1 family peptidase [Streptomyces stelliscabiei]MBE1597468.1 streptogrisin D [Streptomyces stelliscabiei]MDX2513606.1 S1 family peptidase [Streptomyces stelliscabiei]
MRRLSTPRTSMTVAICSLFAVLAAPTANATPVPASMAGPAQVRALVASIGADRTGGTFYDGDGQLVVAVTDEAAARTVRAQGGTAKVVEHSTADLNSVRTTLDRRIADTDPIPNTAWGVDQSTNQVTVSIFDGVSAADHKRLTDLVAGYGDKVRVEELPGGIKETAYESLGGIGIVAPYGPTNCTLGFNVRDSSGKRYFVTAGHCASTDDERFWHREAGGIYLGKRTEWWDFGEVDKDYAVIEYLNDDVAAYGAVRAAGATFEITDSRYPQDGESVKRAGAVSSDLVGQVINPSVTFTFPSGKVMKNMIETSHCALPGDSGGPLWAGTDALGITSATNTPKDASCNSAQNQYRTFFQPVHWVLARYGLSAF